MIDMKNTKASAESTLVAQDMVEEYPYGLRIRLGNEELSKLGIKEMPAIDTEMKLTALVCVIGINQSDSANGEPYRSVELQIEKMSLVSAKEEDNATAKAMYPSMLA